MLKGVRKRELTQRKKYVCAHTHTQSQRQEIASSLSSSFLLQTGSLASPDEGTVPQTCFLAELPKLGLPGAQEREDTLGVVRRTFSSGTPEAEGIL